MTHAVDRDILNYFLCMVFVCDRPEDALSTSQNLQRALMVTNIISVKFVVLERISIV